MYRFCVGHLPSQKQLLLSHFRLLHRHLRGFRLRLVLGLTRRGGGRWRGQEQRLRREHGRLELEKLCHLLEDNINSSNICKPVAVTSIMGFGQMVIFMLFCIGTVASRRRRSSIRRRQSRRPRRRTRQLCLPTEEPHPVQP